MMMSRKAEERNEKIIRGLMKLPPNRRCINCNTLGPQYVCTNFWTFVCMICSGIHREFTHRVKSVSMSKFTAQEVEALQRGGNQRARETFLIDWDPQRQKFPNGSDADKVREFIKNVYVDRRYAAGKTSEKPPRILQDHKSHGDLTRRASSYHSYSQSPPYDYQYEERRYGKQAFTLIRKAGCDRGLKTSGSFSPSRLADPVNEENFANESSNSRSSNYSTSSSGSPYRSINQAPTTQKGIKFSSTSSETLRERVDLWNQKVNTFSDTNTNLDKVKAPHSQRTASDSSSASFSSSSMSFNSLNSENAYGPEKASGTPCKLTTFLSLPSSSVSGNYDSPELFDTVFSSQTVTSSTSDSDLFRSPELSSNLPIDLFQPSFMSSISTASCQELSLASQPLFSDQKQSVATLNETSLDLVNQQNHRWATFDGPQNMPSQGSQSCTGAAIPEGSSVSNANQHLFQNTTRQWSAFHDSSAQATYPSMPIQWHGSPHNNVALPSSSNQQSWNAYESCVGQLSLESIYQQSSQHITGTNPSLIANQYLDLRVQEGIYKDGMPSASIETGPSIHSIQSYTMAGVSSKTNRRSTNPFDIAYESDLVPSNMLLDMDSMQGVLPNIKLPTAFSDGVTDPWFARNSETLYVPTGPQGALGLFGGPVPSTQLMGVPSQGPVAPVGGNPFA